MPIDYAVINRKIATRAPFGVPDLSSCELSAESLSNFDCVLIATNHDAFDYDLIRREAKLIVDIREFYREAFEMW
jgi:UDP-N-acetyl-D-glucosamine dehydrogenase